MRKSTKRGTLMSLLIFGTIGLLIMIYAIKLALFLFVPIGEHIIHNPPYPGGNIDNPSQYQEWTPGDSGGGGAEIPDLISPDDLSLQDQLNQPTPPGWGQPSPYGGGESDPLNPEGGYNPYYRNHPEIPDDQLYR